jgi:IS5 family transposase
MSVRHANLQPVLGASVSDLVRSDHPYRHLLRIVPFDELCSALRSLYSPVGRKGYPVESMFKALLLQWMEELSDRELERFLEENLAGKLFCGFELGDETPDSTTCCTFRDRIGTEGVAALFNRVRDSLKDAGLVREVFTFVDATHLVSKLNLWNERDKVIEAGEKKLSNQNISKVASDKEARFGKKGPLKWYGYKIHASVDMSQGLVVRVAVTAANVEDTKAARHVLPRQGMVFGDKAYGVGDSSRQMKKRGLHSGAILKNDMKAKNRDKDRWLSGVRMPYEGTFSKFEKRARYRGLVNTQFQAFMQAFSHNMKRLVTLEAPPLTFRPRCA